LLSGVDFDIVSYTIVLCSVVCIVASTISYVKYVNIHTHLKNLLSDILYTSILPTEKNLIYNDFNKVIKKLNEKNIEILNNTNLEKREMQDYYTLWAHQIKTPISAIRLLLQNSDDIIQNKEVLSELIKIEMYVDMVLSYVRLNDSSDYVIKSYPIDSIVKQAIRKYAPLFIRKNISLVIENIDLVVCTDEKWLTFVIEQILSNALKYTNKGKIVIFIKNKNTLVIEDTGIGIAKEDIPRIFEKGFTGYNGRKDKKATGLGLYLCKSILTKLSHEINIESKISAGTKVMIKFSKANIIIE
jgi:signal transduction histidine kinase